MSKNKKQLLIAFDVETHLISYPDKVNPPGVCISFSTEESCQTFCNADYTETRMVGDRMIWSYLYSFDLKGLKVIGKVFQLAAGGECKLIAHNAAFDLHVCRQEMSALDFCWAVPNIIPNLWMALKHGSISDTMVREQLYKLSTKGDLGCAFSLAALVDRWLGIDISDTKSDETSPRYRYQEKDGVPISEWEPKFIEYAISDTAYTLAVWLAQEEARAARGVGSMNQEALNVASAYALRGMTLEGIKVNGDVVEELKREYIPKYEEAREKLKDYGLMNEKGVLSKNLTRAVISEVVEKEGLKIPKLTDGGDISTDREVLEFLSGFGDTRIEALLEHSILLKGCTTFIPQLSVDRIHPDFNNIVTTLRTSCRSSNYHQYKGDRANALTATGKPRKIFVHSTPSMNFQQVPRGGAFRKAFIPDEGYIFVDADYANLEFIIASAVLEKETGHHKLRDLLNTGTNIHDALCTVQYNDLYNKNLTEEEGLAILKDRSHPEHKKLKNVRQNATKQISLGVAGGLMLDTAYANVRSKGFKSVTKEMVSSWLSYAKDRFPEFKDWFGLDKPWDGKLWKSYRVKPGRTKYVKKLKKSIKIEYSAEICGAYLANKTRNQMSNAITMQTPSALGMKRATVALYQKMTDPGLRNVLFGCKLHANVHDEALCAVPVDRWEECMREICETMCDAMIGMVPKNRITVEACIQEHWGKSSTGDYPIFEAWKIKGGQLNLNEV